MATPKSKELYTHLVPTPSRKSMNSGLSAAKVTTLTNIFGAFPSLPENCSGSSKNPHVARLLETRNVGPFRCTGIKPFLDALTRAFAKLKAAHPILHSMIGTEGAFCYRAVRGTRSKPSNHSAGTAIDLKVNGFLPPMDYSPESPDMIPNGFVIMYGYLHEEGIFWAAGYKGDRLDTMHFEAADETLKKWDEEGKI